MDTGGAEGIDKSGNPTLRAIAFGRRRAVLGFLLDRSAPVTEQALATTLAVMGPGKPVTDVTAAGMRAIRTELVHVHLPVLTDVGLVAHDRTDGTVTTASHPALDDPRFRQLLAVDEDFDTVLSHLAHQRRRIVLTALRDAGTPMSRSELAVEVLRRKGGTSDPDPKAIEDIAISLHHIDLPKLVDDGLVEYDHETGRTAYVDYPALEAAFRIIDEPDEHLVDKFDRFLDGLGASYQQAGQDTDDRPDWPHHWRDPHHG